MYADLVAFADIRVALMEACCKGVERLQKSTQDPSTLKPTHCVLQLILALRYSVATPRSSVAQTCGCYHLRKMWLDCSDSTDVGVDKGAEKRVIGPQVAHSLAQHGGPRLAATLNCCSSTQAPCKDHKLPHSS